MAAPYVQLQCRGCGGYLRTRTRANTTRCRACGTTRYVPAAPEWEGPDDTPSRASEHPALSRPPVWLSCLGCEYEWESRAAGGSTVRCPDCRHPTWVPVDRPEHHPTPRRSPAELIAGALLPAPEPIEPEPTPAARRSWWPTRRPRPVAPPPAPAAGGPLPAGQSDPAAVRAVTRLGLTFPADPSPRGSCQLAAVNRGPCRLAGVRVAHLPGGARVLVCSGHGHAVTTQAADRGIPVTLTGR